MGIARQFVAASRPAPIQHRPAPVEVKAVDPIKAAVPASGQKRGPKPSGSAKRLISLRLDPDVIDGFKSTGEGWQARMNAVLRTHLNL